MPQFTATHNTNGGVFHFLIPPWAACSANHTPRIPQMFRKVKSVPKKGKPENPSVFVDKAVNQIITATESAIGEKPNCKDAMG